MCVDLGTSLPIERSASLRGMDQQLCPGPLDLRLRKSKCRLADRGPERRPAGKLAALGDSGSVGAEWQRPEASEGQEASTAALRGGSRVPLALSRCLAQSPPDVAGERGTDPGADGQADLESWQRAGKEGARAGPGPPATPASQPTGTIVKDEDKWKMGKTRLSLPPRKRPYTLTGKDQSPIPLKTAHLEETVPSGANQQAPVRLKEEPEDTFSYCGRQEHPVTAQLAIANGYPFMESVYMPFRLQLPYYPGVNKTYLPASSFPICPVPTHPLPIGTLPAFHPGPCPVLCTQEDLLASDIAMATRQDEDGDTPLHIAVVQEDVKMIEKLIQLLLLGKKDLDIYNNLRQTPLHLAVITKQSNIVRQLVNNGASRVLLDRNGQTAVHLASEHGSLACLQSLLGSGRENVDLEIRNYDGYTPLHVAVNSRHKELVALLLDQGADVDAVDIKSGRTPLVHSVENNYMDMVNLLLQHGANVNLQTYSGNTALHSSSGRGLMEIVKALLKNGADSSIKNCHNDTSLMVAKNKKVIDILRGKASRTVSQPPPSQRAPSVIKECDSSSSKSNSPLPGPHVLSCPSPGAHQARSPLHLLLPSASSPTQGSPSNQSSDSQASCCQQSPQTGATTRSCPGVPKPDGERQPDDASLSVQEERGPPVTLPYPWEKLERRVQDKRPPASSPSRTPPVHQGGHCPLGHAAPPMFQYELLGHPIHPSGGFTISPFHQRHPAIDGSFLNFLGGPLPALAHPAFATHPQCPPSQHASIKERPANAAPPKHFRDASQPPLQHQGRPPSRNSDRSDISTLSTNSAGRGES
ncbi:uncharacterized protein bcl3 [Heterodontus francisci]|uniref:uncharacterized protein bcl3 n=1 Tax=Heterodontus francisci TaxID=7792 RepID=UPI00355C8A0F